MKIPFAQLAKALPALPILFLVACGSPEEELEVSGATKLSPEQIEEALAVRHPGAEAHFAENSDFFQMKTASDLPAGLLWKSGAEQAEFASPKALRGGTERIWVQDFPRTLRVVGPDSATSFRGFIHDNQEMSLVKKHPETGGYFPGLCSEWAISEDRKTAWFRLDPEARFSDGVPLKARHFFFTFYFMRSPWIQAPWYNNWYSEKYTRIAAYGDDIIEVGLKDAKPDTLRFFEEDLYPLPEHFYAEFEEDFINRYAWRFAPTTGPYVIHAKDIRKGRTLTQTRLDDWWANDKKFWRFRFNPDYREFSVIRDPEKALEAFISGDYEMQRIRTPDVWQEKLDKPPVQKGYIARAQFYNQIPRPCYSLRLNKSKRHLDNLDIRIGLQHASNFDLVLEQYFRGRYERMQTSSDGYGEFTNPDIKVREFSPAKAREHFAKAGFTKSGPDGILVNEQGQRLSFTVSTGYKRFADVLTILEREARKAGVEFQIEIIDATAAWKKAQEKKHEICFTALNRSVELYPRYWDFWHSFNAYKEDGSVKAETNNFTVTAYPEWDELIDRYEQSTDLAEIKSIAYELEQKIHDDASFIPGWIRPYLQCAYWRWVQWPEGFNARLAREHDELCIHWIDPKIKAETEAAMKSGKEFEETTLIFDQHQRKP
ncbi:MAG: ABC transporter substrate-binding protein [Verrucomicrobiales bacterium]|nr:ABC transporter substrate-binding protein [Verrucomicrobiales bacterium]